jgi:hypothetical protein
VPNFTTPHSNSLPQGEREVRLELRSDDKIFCRIRVNNCSLVTWRRGDRGRHMPAYEIYFRCDDCKREHPIHLRIYLDGPERKENLAAFLRGHSMPPQVTTIRGRKVFCLKTGRIFRVEDDDQIFLIPFTGSNFPRRPIRLIPDDE